MRKCCVPGCSHQQIGKRSIFSLPKDPALLEQWYEVLPVLRTARPSNRICHLHFQPSDIHSVFTHSIGGKIYMVERERTQLKANAVPSLNLPSRELAMQLITSKKRRIGVKSKKNDYTSELNNEVQTDITAIETHLARPDEQNYAIIDSTNEIVYHQYFEDNLSVAEPYEGAVTIEHTKEPLTPLDGRLMFDNLFDDVYEVLLPNTLWGMHHCPRRTFLMFAFMDVSLLSATKILIIDNVGRIKTYLASRLISEKLLSLDILTTELISELLQTLDLTRICAGADASKDCLVKLKDDERLCVKCLQKLTTQ